jgi:hypothetical protein
MVVITSCHPGGGDDRRFTDRLKIRDSESNHICRSHGSVNEISHERKNTAELGENPNNQANIDDSEKKIHEAPQGSVSGLFGFTPF